MLTFSQASDVLNAINGKPIRSQMPPNAEPDWTPESRFYWSASRNLATNAIEFEYRCERCEGRKRLDVGEVGVNAAIDVLVNDVETTHFCLRRLVHCPGCARVVMYPSQMPPATDERHYRALLGEVAELPEMPALDVPTAL